MRVVIFTADSNGGYPVPATKGGAVSTLIESLVSEDNKQNLCDMTIVSLYEQKAAEIAKEKYSNIHFHWVIVPRMVQALDKIMFLGIKTFFKKKKAISYKSIFSLLWYIRISAKYLKENAFDKVVLENNVPIAAIIKKSGYKGEYYYHFHNIPRINANCQEVFDHCNGYLCVSKYVGEEIEKCSNAIGPISKDKVKILYNCIDTKLFKPLDKEDRAKVRTQICKKYCVPEEQKLVIFAGRLSREKGPDQLLKAIKDMDDVTALIVGGLLSGLNLNDSYQNEIHVLAEQLGKRIIFTGYIDRMNLPEFYNAADMAVLPSMWDEPAGLTMIEAMACGTPIITTRSGGIPEYVGDAAYVLDRDDKLPEKIAETMKKYFALRNDEQDIVRKREIKRIQEKFSNEQYLGRFVLRLKK